MSLSMTEPVARPPATDDADNPIERRLVMRVLKRWRELAGDRAMPALADIMDEAMPELWPSCFVLGIEAGTTALSFRHVGAAFVDDGVSGLIGHPPSAAPSDTLLGQAVKACPIVMRKQVPNSVGGSFTHRSGRLTLYRAIVLPLAPDGRQLEALIGAVNGRSVSDE